MSSSAIDKAGRGLILDRKSTEADRQLAVAAYLDGGLACDECGDTMHPVVRQDPRKRVWHFAHNASDERACSKAAGESDDHGLLKNLIVSAARQAGAAAYLEVPDAAGKRRCDVTIRPDGGTPQYWEVQLAAESYADHVRRHADLAATGQPVWVTMTGNGWHDGHPWVVLALDGSIRAGITATDGCPVVVGLPKFIAALTNGDAIEMPTSWQVPDEIVDRFLPFPSRLPTDTPYLPALAALGYDATTHQATAAYLGPRHLRIAPLEPPFPDRFTGAELQARIDGIRGNVASRLVDCERCGGRMIENRHGGHLGCLGLASTQAPLDGPRIAGDWIDGPIGAHGRQRAADEAAAAKAAELIKAAMAPPPPAPEQPPVVLEPDVDTQRRITKQMRAAGRCDACGKPMLTGAYDWTDETRPRHFICAEAERQGIPIDEIVALRPTSRVKGRKGRDLANVIWQTTVDETEKHWTDWGAAVATPDEGEHPT